MYIVNINLIVLPLFLSLSEQFCLPRRVFCPIKAAGPVCVCDYHFNDEGLSEVTERLKEMLDMDAAEEELDTQQEMSAEVTGSHTVTAGLEGRYVIYFHISPLRKPLHPTQQQCRRVKR